MPGLLSPAGGSPGAPAPTPGRGKGWRKMDVPAERIRELHGQGASERAIAGELGISKALVGKKIKELGLEPHPQRSFKDIDWGEFTRLREAGMPMDVIAKELGVSERTLLSRREAEGRRIEPWGQTEREKQWREEQEKASRTILSDKASPFSRSNYNVLHEPQMEELLIELYGDKAPIKNISKRLSKETGEKIDIPKINEKLKQLREQGKVGTRASPSALSEVDFTKALDLLSQGYSYAEVARELGLTNRNVLVGKVQRFRGQQALPGTKKAPDDEW